jgi:hypothetical protein
MHSWARLLKQPFLITVNRLPTKENYYFRLQKANVSLPFETNKRNCRFPLVPFCVCMVMWGCMCGCVCTFFIYIYFNYNFEINIYMLPFQTENGNPANFHNLFTVCSSCRWKFVVCLFVDEEINGSYRFAYRDISLFFLSSRRHVLRFSKIIEQREKKDSHQGEKTANPED